jgi:hypothetical protein
MSGHARACTSTSPCILPATPDDTPDDVIADVGMMTSSPAVGAGARTCPCPLTHSPIAPCCQCFIFHLEFWREKNVAKSRFFSGGSAGRKMIKPTGCQLNSILEIAAYVHGDPVHRVARANRKCLTVSDFRFRPRSPSIHIVYRWVHFPIFSLFARVPPVGV